MDLELRELLEPYLRPVESSAGQTLDQALNFSASSLAYIARTFLDWDGEISLEEIRELLVAKTALG